MTKIPKYQKPINITFRLDKIENFIWDWARFDLNFIESANIAYLFASKDAPCLKSIFFSSCRYIKINPNLNFDQQESSISKFVLTFFIDMTRKKKNFKQATSSAKLKKINRKCVTEKTCDAKRLLQELCDRFKVISVKFLFYFD